MILNFFPANPRQVSNLEIRYFPNTLFTQKNLDILNVCGLVQLCNCRQHLKKSFMRLAYKYVYNKIQ